MTDEHYVKQLSEITKLISRLNPMDQDDIVMRDKLLDDIHAMNIEWKHGRQLRRCHYIIQLIILSAILAFVIWTMIR